MPGPSSGTGVPSATPIPLQVLTRPEVSWTGGFTGLGDPAEWGNRPNALNDRGEPIYVPPESLNQYARPQAWLETSPGSYASLGDWDLWDKRPQNYKDAAVASYQSGTQVPSGAFPENASQMPSMESYQSMDAIYKQLIPEWETIDPAVWRAGVYRSTIGDFEGMATVMGGGSASSMDPYNAGMLDLNNRKFEFEQRQYQDELTYQQQALAQQAQQAAAAAAAQRRAQAMSLAESILGMQQQQWAQVSGWALPAGSQTAPGWEQGGAVSQMFANQGLPYTPIQAVQTPGVDYAPAYQWARQLLGGS